jgi:hypothetical protein
MMLMMVTLVDLLSCKGAVVVTAVTVLAAFLKSALYCYLPTEEDEDDKH